jgi:hypothetical protein
MPTKQLDRLLFAQGGHCFFCKKQLPKAEASIEHLVASAKGGANHDENCVVCCKAVNALLGSMSLKEKVQVVLNQKGQFKCPNGAGSAKAPTKSKPISVPAAGNERLGMVLANLKQRGNSRPRKRKTLMSTVASLFPKGLSEAELTSLITQLEISGKVAITDDNVTYGF